MSLVVNDGYLKYAGSTIKRLQVINSAKTTKV